jgi:hypothetical protein
MNRPLHSQYEQLTDLPRDLSPAQPLASCELPVEFPSYHRPDDPAIRLSAGASQSTRSPQSSLRAYRRNFTIACTVFTLGSMMILFSSSGRNEWIAPGPLSSHHAPLTASEKGDRCAACHAAANVSLASWIGSFFSAQKNQGLSQSELCMKCHERSITSQFAMHPHNVSPGELIAVSQRLSSASQTSPGSSWLPSVASDHEIACSTCHQEHHGGDQLTTLTDAQCQTCHSQKFTSFELGHPEFTNYPQQRRSRIAFDHASHFGKHFHEKGKAFDCALCHLDDDYRNVKRLAPFEQSCAQCHSEQILDSVSAGFVLLSLPMLDMQAIEHAGLNVGSWPLTATGDFDGAIPPLMRVLLLADSEAKEILLARGSHFEFFDLDAENHNDVRDAVILTWAIKRLIDGLSVNGPQELSRRFEQVLGVTVSNGELSRLISTLDHSVFFLMQHSWLPNLRSELNSSRSPIQEGQTSEVLSHHPKAFSASHPRRRSGVDDDLLAVNPLAELMKGLAERSPSSQAAEEVRPHETVDRLASPEKEMWSEPENSATKTQSEGFSSGSDKLPGQSEPTMGTSDEPNLALFDPLNRPSGWYRNDTMLQISYRATGHADPCLKAWIDFAARIPDLSKRAELEPVLTQILSAQGVGRCQSCHTIDQVSENQLGVNWTAHYRNPAVRGFTKFSHASHLVHSDLKDCSKCHELNSQRTNAHSFVSFDASEVESNFRPLVKKDCLQCHQPGRTNSSCMQCHHYHVDRSR